MLDAKYKNGTQPIGLSNVMLTSMGLNIVLYHSTNTLENELIFLKLMVIEQLFQRCAPEEDLQK